MAYGAFSEWGVMPARHALPVPEPAPEVVALLTSGLTASIGTPTKWFLVRTVVVQRGSSSCKSKFVRKDEGSGAHRKLGLATALSLCFVDISSIPK